MDNINKFISDLFDKPELIDAKVIKFFKIEGNMARKYEEYQRSIETNDYD